MTNKPKIAQFEVVHGFEIATKNGALNLTKGQLISLSLEKAARFSDKLKLIECWLQCQNSYHCEDCQHGLREPMIISSEGWGKSKPFYFGCDSRNREPMEPPAAPPPPQRAPAGMAACQACDQIGVEGRCRRYGKAAADVIHCMRKEQP